MIDPKLIENYFDRLWPINRSLTGNGNRESIKILSEIIPLKTKEIPSGTQCFDWNVPNEWNVTEAWVKDPNGDVIINFAENNLHLLGYSVPFKGKLPLAELKEHLYSLPDQPNVIPYLTSYYKRRWGFCLSHNQLIGLKEGMYEICIDAKLDPQGSMTIADAIIPGKIRSEVMFSTYICHPSLANNELSGPLVTAFLYEILKTRALHYTYRFVFVPETIGSICYLSDHGEHLKDNLIAGFVVSTVGDGGALTYKMSRRKDTLVDRATLLVLKQLGKDFTTVNFNPADGSDERQYCSPGFDLPVGSLMRTMYGKYKEYHTSLDNKDIMDFDAMSEIVALYGQVVDVIENNKVYINLKPYGEPQLGKRGLYSTLGSQTSMEEISQGIFWFLNLADGTRDLIDISNESGVKYGLLVEVAKRLMESDLIKIA